MGGDQKKAGPGCGCPDEYFHGKHDFEGDLKNAIEEAKKISHNKYRGDFRWWITEKDKNEILAC